MINKGNLTLKQLPIQVTPQYLKPSKFLGSEFQTIIYNDIDFVEILEIKVDTITFIVNHYSSSKWENIHKKRDVKCRLSKILDALSITIGMSNWSSCNLEGKQVIVNMFDIDKPKEFITNNKVITPLEVNSAYTIPCRYKQDVLEIVIFRNEEWEKVLFHELMHLYSYDIESNDKRINSRLTRIFNVEHNFQLAEAYSEFWARVLWCLWKSNGNLREFSLEINKQQQWSIYQGIVVLTNTGLIDTVLGEKTDIVKNYKEKTSAFSYYVITGFMMSNWKNILLWCYENNDIPFKFNYSLTNISSFISLFRDIVNDEGTLYLWWIEEQKLPKYFYKYALTARMTI